MTISVTYEDASVKVEMIAEPWLGRVTARVSGAVFDKEPGQLGESPTYYEAWPLKRLQPSYNEDPERSLRMYAAALAGTVARDPKRFAGASYSDWD